ncbi:hypothetical protein BMR05_15070 [Methylococcaceae bacterium HT4]|nr:hypothetical protein BMR05_15070 [Methylococcaceae bacterium HT4]TXL13517.1 hypothetical protein BMR04_14255 [Methylococcaceae bacterium HT3]TXL20543.1 hypothetical protein BMR03_14350 [Methylococcaceae bacterium HT2]
MKNILALISLLLFSTFVEADRAAELNNYLSVISTEYNKTLPMMVEKDIELSTTLTRGSELILMYRTVILLAYKSKKSRLINKISSDVTLSTCSNSTIRKLLNAGATITSLYVGKENDIIGSIRVTRNEC